MTTKEKILVTALSLFNQKGVETVTTRQIALALGISQGNLCYHFSKKEDIIFALYQQLVQKFDKTYQELDLDQISIDLFFKLTAITNQHFLDYKFLMLNFVQIMRWHPQIKAHYQELTFQRNQQLIALFHAFQQAGLLQTEAYVGQYLQMMEQFVILNNFWLSHAEILYQGTEKMAHFNQLIAAYIFPFLTEKGQVEFRKIKS